MINRLIGRFLPMTSDFKKYKNNILNTENHTVYKNSKNLYSWYNFYKPCPLTEYFDFILFIKKEANTVDAFTNYGINIKQIILIKDLLVVVVNTTNQELKKFYQNNKDIVIKINKLNL